MVSIWVAPGNIPDNLPSLFQSVVRCCQRWPDDHLLGAYVRDVVTVPTELGPSSRTLVLSCRCLNHSWPGSIAAPMASPSVSHIRPTTHRLAPNEDDSNFSVAETAIQLGVCLWLSRQLHESPRWLMAQHRITEATAILRRIALANGTQLPLSFPPRNVNK